MKALFIKIKTWVRSLLPKKKKVEVRIALPKFHTTMGDIDSWGPCSAGMLKLTKALGNPDSDYVVSLSKILETNGVEDVMWAFRTQPYKHYCLLLADILEYALPKFEDEEPGCNYIRKAIECIRDWERGDIPSICLKNMSDDLARIYHSRSSGIIGTMCQAASHATMEEPMPGHPAGSPYIVARKVVEFMTGVQMDDFFDELMEVQWDNIEKVVVTFLEEK